MKLKNIVFSILLTMWSLIGLVVIATVMQKHFIIFNPNSDVVIRELSSLNGQKINPEKWTLQHVLSPECGCSKAVYEYLLERKAQSEYNEIVTLIGEQTLWTQTLEKVGFVVKQIKASDLNEKEMVGVPFLAIRYKNQQVYLGGYGEHFIKKKSDVRDLDIVAQLQGRGKTQNVFPVYGCAASAKYKNKSMAILQGAFQ